MVICSIVWMRANVVELQRIWWTSGLQRTCYDKISHRRPAEVYDLSRRARWGWDFVTIEGSCEFSHQSKRHELITEQKQVFYGREIICFSTLIANFITNYNKPNLLPSTNISLSLHIYINSFHWCNVQIIERICNIMRLCYIWLLFGL